VLGVKARAALVRDFTRDPTIGAGKAEIVWKRAK
jgi:hypothetical protein